MLPKELACDQFLRCSVPPAKPGYTDNHWTSQIHKTDRMSTILYIVNFNLSLNEEQCVFLSFLSLKHERSYNCMTSRLPTTKYIYRLQVSRYGQPVIRNPIGLSGRKHNKERSTHKNRGPKIKQLQKCVHHTGNSKTLENLWIVT
jgi:hypothetical protein